MKNNIYKVAVIGFLGLGINAFAQETNTTTKDYTGKVGINTSTPNATLDVVAKNDDGSTIEGLKTPQLTGDALQTMTSKLGEENDGLVVYVTTAVNTPDTGTRSVTWPGYYRFNYKAKSPSSTKQEIDFYPEKSWVRLEPTGLEVVVEGSNAGRRLIGVNPDRYANIGSHAVDMSYQNKGTTDGGASGNYSTAIGVGTKAQGANSFAGGQQNTASGKNAVSIVGYNNNASGINSFAGGEQNIASGINSFAAGQENIASGKNSFAFGLKNDAQSIHSVVFGNNTKVTVSSTEPGNDGIGKSRNSVAMGQNTEILDSPNSLAYGANVKIINSQNAFAGGAKSEVISGNSSVALGNEVKVTRNGAVGIGSSVQVNGNGAIALGANAKVGVYNITIDTSNNNKITDTGVSADGGIAIGPNATVTGTNGIAIGLNANAGASEVAIGSDSTVVILGKLKKEASYSEGGSCTSGQVGKIVYTGTSFLGCIENVGGTGGTWKKLNN